MSLVPVAATPNVPVLPTVVLNIKVVPSAAPLQRWQPRYTAHTEPNLTGLNTYGTSYFWNILLLPLTGEDSKKESAPWSE